MRSAREGADDLAVRGRPGGDINVVNEDPDPAVDRAGNGGDDAVDGGDNTDLGPGGGCSAARDDASAGVNASAGGAVEGELVRMTVSSNGGADDRDWHAEEGGVLDKAWMLAVLVNKCSRSHWSDTNRRPSGAAHSALTAVRQTWSSGPTPFWGGGKKGVRMRVSEDGT